MSKAKNGDTVKVHYTGKLDDGTVFDSSMDSEPLEFTLGEQKIIPGFEEAVEGMEAGEEKTVKIPPEQAYGDRREENVIDVERSSIPEDITPEPGMMLQLTLQDGSVANVVVADVKDEMVTLDGNHPLAGKELNFDIKLVEVE
jgi:FKBP-type peptidyl-prolyl cis-trans isomerase 2